MPGETALDSAMAIRLPIEMIIVSSVGRAILVLTGDVLL